MSKFHFRLEPVLQQRESKEKEAIQAQAWAHKKYIECLEKYEGTCHELDRYMEQDAGSDCFDAINHLMYRELLSIKADEQKQELEKKTREFEKSREKTIEARKQKLVMENLKQNRYREFIYELNKEEQKEIDELATQTTLRNIQDGVTSETVKNTQETNE